MRVPCQLDQCEYYVLVMGLGVVGACFLLKEVDHWYGYVKVKQECTKGPCYPLSHFGPIIIEPKITLY